MYKPNPAHTHLAEEFKRRPIGEHSPDLQYLLNYMRQPDGKPFYVLSWNGNDEVWTLALLEPGGRRRPVPTEHVFHKVEDAEWFVFKRRWAAVMNAELEID